MLNHLEFWTLPAESEREGGTEPLFSDDGEEGERVLFWLPVLQQQQQPEKSKYPVNLSLVTFLFRSERATRSDSRSVLSLRIAVPQ